MAKMSTRGTGLVHIYCGDGKGKTTCGMGLCARAAGFGYRVLIYQFMKDNSTSERRLLEQSENITFMDGLEHEKFSFQMTAQEKAERAALYEARLEAVIREAVSGQYDVLFLDEAVYAVRAGLLRESLLTDFLDSKPENLEVILTGRDPGEALCERADYISRIEKVKHPFDRQIPAREGIER